MGLLFFPSPNAEKRIRKESVATQVPWSLKSWGLLYRLHLRWVSLVCLANLLSFQWVIKHVFLPEKKSVFLIACQFIDCGTTIRLARAHSDRLNSGKICIQSGRLINISIKSFGWSSKIRTGSTSVVLRDIARQHVDVMPNCRMNTREIDRTPWDDFFITRILSSLLGYFSTRSTGVCDLYMKARDGTLKPLKSRKEHALRFGMWLRTV